MPTCCRQTQPIATGMCAVHMRPASGSDIVAAGNGAGVMIHVPVRKGFQERPLVMCTKTLDATGSADAAGAVPVIGNYLVEFLRGGPVVDNQTLGRFFALHVVGMPLILLGLIGVHLFCVKRRGISAPPFGPDYRASEELPFFEHEKHPDLSLIHI